jgi:branched-chain amino acid transport system permease protein
VGDDILTRYKNRLISLAFILVFVGLPALVGDNAYLMLILSLSGIFVIASIGLDLLFGYSGQISIGQAAFYAVGAYTSAILTTKLGASVWLGMLAGGVLATVFAALVALPICKLVHMFLALVTIGIGELTYQAIINLPDLTGSFTGVRAIPMPRIGAYVFNVSSYYYIVLAFVVLSLIVKQRIVDSRIGRAFIAIRENTDAANAMGINVTYYKVVAFACSAAFTGIAGALYAHYIGFISPETFTLDQSVLFLTAVLCGGMGTFVGPIIGAVVITVINEAIQALGAYQMLVYGIFIVVAVIYVPEGLVGVVKMIRRNLFKVVNRVAD